MTDPFVAYLDAVDERLHDYFDGKNLTFVAVDEQQTHSAELLNAMLAITEESALESRAFAIGDQAVSTRESGSAHDGQPRTTVHRPLSSAAFWLGIPELCSAPCNHCAVQRDEAGSPAVSGKWDFRAVVEALVVASRAFVGVAARSIAGPDQLVSLPRLQMPIRLCREALRGVTELASALAVTPSTAMLTRDRLVATSLVSRYRATSDRRSAWTSVAPSGRLLVEEFMTRRRAEIAAIVERMRLRPRLQLRDVLGSFADAAGVVPDQSRAVGWA